MKIILTGATGLLGSQIMYEILEFFINKKIDGKLIIFARNKGKNSASDRINELLSSSYTPKNIRDKGIKKLLEYLEIIDTDLALVQETFLNEITDAYFIHSAGFVNL